MPTQLNGLIKYALSGKISLLNLNFVLTNHLNGTTFSIVESVYIVRKVWAKKIKKTVKLKTISVFSVKYYGKSDNVQQAKKHSSWPFIWTIPFIIHSTKFGLEIYKIYVLLAKKLNTQVNCLCNSYSLPTAIRAPIVSTRFVTSVSTEWPKICIYTKRTSHLPYPKVERAYSNSCSTALYITNIHFYRYDENVSLQPFLSRHSGNTSIYVPFYMFEEAFGVCCGRVCFQVLRSIWKTIKKWIFS